MNKVAPQLIRQTLFVLISAVEDDLRDYISKIFCGHQAKVLFGDVLFQKTKERAIKDYQSSSTGDEIGTLVLYLDFADAYQLILARRDGVPACDYDYLKSINKQLDRLARIRNRVCHSRPIDSVDYLDVINFCESVRGKKDFFGEVNRVMHDLARNPASVLSVTIPVQSDRVSHNLPIVEFEDTGFIGRDDENKAIRQAIRSPFPVVTIIGEGGMGKTALALRVAYDLLDDDKDKFDAVVWVTAKANRVTETEIIEIKDAIKNSLDFIDEAGVVLGAKTVDEIYQYLEEFKVLIIFDNLETVIDDVFREFINNLPSMRSKILITSRIGLGAYEKPIQLKPLKEASLFMRACAKSYALDSLVSCDEIKLKSYCDNLSNNPGFIKWFIASVKSGARPESLFVNNKQVDYITFCMDNVYEKLSPEVKYVLRLFQCNPGKQSIVELTYIGERKTHEIEDALMQLLSTSMVFCDMMPRDGYYVTRYTLNPLAHKYLTLKKPVDRDFVVRISQRKNEMIRISKSYYNEDVYRFGIQSIFMRNKEDAVIVRELRSALECIRNQDFINAEKCIKAAKNLDSSHFEIYRVSAFLNAEKGDYSQASNDYEAAVSLSADKTIPKFYQAGFLMRYMHDAEACLALLSECILAKPNVVDFKLEHARALSDLGRFELARQEIELIKKSDGLSERQYRKIMHFSIQCYLNHAHAEFECGSYTNSFKLVRDALIEYRECSRVNTDSRIRDTLKHVKKAVLRHAAYISPAEIASQLQVIEFEMSY